MSVYTTPLLVSLIIVMDRLMNTFFEPRDILRWREGKKYITSVFVITGNRGPLKNIFFKSGLAEAPSRSTCWAMLFVCCSFLTLLAGQTKRRRRRSRRGKPLVIIY